MLKNANEYQNVFLVRLNIEFCLKSKVFTLKNTLVDLSANRQRELFILDNLCDTKIKIITERGGRI